MRRCRLCPENLGFGCGRNDYIFFGSSHSLCQNIKYAVFSTKFVFVLPTTKPTANRLNCWLIYQVMSATHSKSWHKNLKNRQEKGGFGDWLLESQKRMSKHVSCPKPKVFTNCYMLWLSSTKTQIPSPICTTGFLKSGLYQWTG